MLFQKIAVKIAVFSLILSKTKNISKISFSCPVFPRTRISCPENFLFSIPQEIPNSTLKYVKTYLQKSFMKALKFFLLFFCNRFSQKCVLDFLWLVYHLYLLLSWMTGTAQLICHLCSKSASLLKCIINLLSFGVFRFNSSISNILIDGMDRFRINYVKFSLREKSMNFSLTFTDLKVNGSYNGIGNFIKYIPINGRGNFNFDVYSKKWFSCKCLMNFQRLNFPSDFTTTVVTFVTFKRFRMQITNLTSISIVNRFKVV